MIRHAVTILAGTSILPHYVLHRAPIIVEYAVIVAISLVLTLGADDLLVRRTLVTRFLFGMRG